MVATERPIASGSTFEAVAGDSGAVVDGESVPMAGTTGFDDARMRIEIEVTARFPQ